MPGLTAPKKTWIEHFHRMMSGIFGIVIVAIYIYIRRNFTKTHPIRWASLGSLVLTITEALLGAKLVLSGLVGANDSGLRSFVMGLHFFNSAMLVASITLTALFSAQGQWQSREVSSVIAARVLNRLHIIALGIFLFIGATGTIAALSTTLFPSTSLFEGLSKDLSNDSHMFLRIRALHPTVGVFAGVALALLFLIVAELTKKEDRVRRTSQWVAGLTAAAVVIGTITLLWLSPTALRLTHLALAHAIVISFSCWWHSLRWTSRSESVVTND